MTLSFEHYFNPGRGKSPQGAHFNDNTLRIFYIDEEDGMLHAYDAVPTGGQYITLTWTGTSHLSPDLAISLPRLKRVPHYGVYGYWSDGGDHRFVMYMFPMDLSDHFIDGKISRTVGSKVTSLSASFVNIEHQLVNKKRAVLSPCAKVEFWFSLGDSEEIKLGTFYVDSAQVAYPSGTVTMKGRNAIGRLLKEQQFCEHGAFHSDSINQNFEDILTLAGVEEFFVQVGEIGWNFDFARDLSILDGIEKILGIMPGYVIDETREGAIGISWYADNRFDQPSRTILLRERECFSFDIAYDDSQAAARVCVVSSDTDENDQPAYVIYEPVARNQYWAQPTYRTNFYKAPKGTSEEDAQAMAKSLAESLSTSGRLESFVGLFKPQLMIGDEVAISNNDTQIANIDMIGTITDISHTFGTKGFSTAFTVDSGGRRGKDRLSNLISKMQTTQTQGVTIS